MKITRLCLICFGLFVASACMSIKDYSVQYFYLRQPVSGVENAAQLFKRLNESAKDREIIDDSKEQARKMATCAIFRNQLFVATLSGLSGDDGKKVKACAQAVEVAYQANSEEFLSICTREMNTEVGQAFLAAQQQFIAAK